MGETQERNIALAKSATKGVWPKTKKDKEISKGQKMNIEDMFMKVLFAFLFIGAIAYLAIVVSSTPARCWLSHAPFTCAKTIELEQIIKDNK